LGLVTTPVYRQFVAQAGRKLIEPAPLVPRLRQDLAELDHVRVVEVVQIHPHHRFRDVEHLHEEISNSHQDVILGLGGPLGTNVAVDEHAVKGCGMQTDEMFAELEVAKDGLAERNGSIREPAMDPRNSRRDERLLLSGNLAFMGVTHIRGHEPSSVLRRLSPHNRTVNAHRGEIGTRAAFVESDEVLWRGPMACYPMAY
jgi:hypothetical protein